MILGGKRKPQSRITGLGLIETRPMPAALVRAGGSGLRGARIEVLPIAQSVDVLQHRRTGWQIGRHQKVLVERIVSRGRAVNLLTALENAGGIFRVVHADERTAIVQGGSTPGFDVAQEVVPSAVGA